MTLHPYRLPLTAPLRLAFGTIAHRDGLLLRLDDDAGRVGWGDVCPLPGFSPDTLAEAETSLRRWAEDDDDTALTPSAHAALDGARLDLDAQARGVTMAEALRTDAASTVALQALLVRDDPADARSLRAAGYRAVKMKVGGDPLADAARVRAVAEALGPNVTLRLDANRAWRWDDACRFADAVRGVPLGYVEEPLYDPARLPDLVRDTGLPVALDESLRNLAPDDLARHGYAVAVVLKPVVLGGVRRALAWADAARAAGLDAVVSGAFESGVGTRHALALAAALGGCPAGLDPYRRLAADVLAPRLRLDRPTVDVAEAMKAAVILAETRTESP